jgi:multicomponent Na+:H+ antiporter subunit E
MVSERINSTGKRNVMARFERLRFMKHLAFSFMLWLVVTGGDADSLVVGIPTVLFAALTMSWLERPESTRWKFAQIIPFALFFLRSSLMGGIDVARRALLPALPIDPGFVQFAMRIEPCPAQVFFINAVSLLPGTLSAGLQGNQLCVHVIDKSQPNEVNLRELERQVARLFSKRWAEQTERN